MDMSELMVELIKKYGFKCRKCNRPMIVLPFKDDDYHIKLLARCTQCNGKDDVTLKIGWSDYLIIRREMYKDDPNDIEPHVAR